MYKIRAILDTKKDVLRTISIDEHCNLEQLHFAVSSSFGFDGKEMASFFKTDDDWNQGEEIPLFNMSEDGIETTMKNYLLKDIITKKRNKLIYVYDFFEMWTFYIELIETSSKKVNEPKIVLSVGNKPDKAPEKKFKADNYGNSFEDDLDDFNNLDYLDDFDPDNF